MVINNITKIDNEKGVYIVLEDFGPEGIAVHSQHDTMEEAISAQPISPRAIVRLIDFGIDY